MKKPMKPSLQLLREKARKISPNNNKKKTASTDPTSPASQIKPGKEMQSPSDSKLEELPEEELKMQLTVSKGLTGAQDTELNKFVNELSQGTGFSELSTDQIKRVKQRLTKLSFPVTLEHALALRHIQLDSKASSNNGHCATVSSKYDPENSSTLIHLANEAGVPPLSIGRTVLLNRYKMEAARIEKLLGGLCEGLSLGQYHEEFSDEEKKISDLDFLALQKAAMNDGFTNPCYQNQLRWEEIKFKSKVRTVFLTKKMDFVLNCETKDDEPTFLLRQPLKLSLVGLAKERTVKIKWVDCKNEYGTAERADSNLKKLKQRYDQFTSKHGQGAVFFSEGFCQELQKVLEKTVLVDVRPAIKSCAP